MQRLEKGSRLTRGGVYGIGAGEGGGATGPTGPSGATGPGGATGATGPAGGTNFANFFALMPPDNAATVAVGAPMQFPQNGPTGGATPPTRLTATTFNLPNIGTYEISWQASINEPGQLQLAIGGVGLPNTVVGRATGTNQIAGSTMITTVAINSVLSVINPAGNAAALTVTPIAGGTHAVSATLSIKQLA